MKTRKVDSLRQCDLCGTQPVDCYYDAPTFTGSWANMCESCFIKQGSSSLGTKFILRGPKVPSAEGILDGIEVNELGDDDREIECPECGELRSVEPDAEYVYTCDGCGSKVRVTCLF